MIRRSISLMVAVAMIVALPLVAQQSGQGGAAVPEKAQKEFNKGNEALAQNEFAKALERYMKAVNAYPQYAEALNGAGTVHLKQGELDKASEFFTKAVAANPNYVPAHMNLVRVTAGKGDFAAADAHLQKAAAIDANNPEVLAGTVQLRLMQNRANDAIEAVRKLHAVSHKEYADLHLLAASILESQGKKAEAAVEYRAFLQERPDSEEAGQAKDALSRLEVASAKQ